jgi:hypothetical protein
VAAVVPLSAFVNSVAGSGGGAVAGGPAAALDRLPLAFEANQGQTNPSVDFLARGKGYSLVLSATQAVLRLRPEGVSGPAQPGQAEQAEQAQPATVVSLSLLDADGQATAAGLDPLPGTINYFVGSDPARWHTGIPT